MKIFRELTDLFKFILLPETEKRFVIFSEHSGYTNLFKPIIEQLLAHKVSICYISSDLTDSYLCSTSKNPRLKVFYSKQVLPSIIGSLVPNSVFLTTTPDIGAVFHYKLPPKVYYVHLFHSIVSSFMTYKFGAFDYFNGILCVGPHHKVEMLKMEELYKLPSKDLYEAGYPRLDDVATEYQSFLNKNLPVPERPIILVAPSWGEGAFIENQKEDAVKMINSLVAENFDVILRYHPETVKRRKDIIAFYDKTFSNNVHVTIEKSVATNDSILKSSQLITDWSGISLEYGLGTLRPVLFVDCPRKVHNPRYEELGLTPFEVSIRSQIGKVISTDKLETIGSEVREMADNISCYQDKIKAVRDEYIYNFEHATLSISDILISIYKKRATQK